MSTAGTIDIKAKVKSNGKDVAAAMEGLGDLFKQFEQMNTPEEIEAHIARVNGYAYALVNMDVITEEAANKKVAYAAVAAAAARHAEICKK